MIVEGRGTKIKDGAEDWKMLNEHTFSGTIEDSLGTAEFYGEQTDDMISFSKTYKKPPHTGLNFVHIGPIRYNGRKVDGKRYEGRYVLKGKVGDKTTEYAGTFLIEPFVDSPTINLIFEQMQEKNKR